MRTILALLLFAAPTEAAEMQPIGRFTIDRTEVTVGAFRRFAEATGTITKAEREGGGQVFEAGWTKKPDGSWAPPVPVGAGSK